MTSYPSELPLDAVRVLMNFVRKESTASASVHAAWEVLGYGLGKAMPIENVFGDSVEPNEEEALESLLSEAPQGILLSVAIGVAIKIAMRILKEIIA